MLLAPDPARAVIDDPELDRLIRAERLRMLYAPSLQVAVVSAELSGEELDRLLDPAHYLGQARVWVARAVSEHQRFTA